MSLTTASVGVLVTAKAATRLVGRVVVGSLGEVVVSTPVQVGVVIQSSLVQVAGVAAGVGAVAALCRKPWKDTVFRRSL